MTQEELATRVGCTRGYIAFLEGNRGTPGQSIYTKLVELFDEFSEPITEVESRSSYSVNFPNPSLKRNSIIF